MLFAELVCAHRTYGGGKPGRADEIGQQDRCKLNRLRHQQPPRTLAQTDQQTTTRRRPDRLRYRVDPVMAANAGRAPAFEQSDSATKEGAGVVGPREKRQPSKTNRAVRRPRQRQCVARSKLVAKLVAR